MSRLTYVPPDWYPDATQRHHGVRPDPGSVVALRRAVWRIVAVEVLPRDQWTPEDVEKVAAYRGNTIGQGNAVPFRVHIEWLGGVRPKRFEGLTGTPVGTMLFRAGSFPTWWVYPHGRWPKCSCCGEPMPCRAELTDLKVDAAVEKMDEFASRMPGTCWGCGEVVTRRQKTVRYVGENLDSPTGPEAVFHIRESCHWLACKYEARWLAADPSRRRIITYPSCRGTLRWYPDGSSVCGGGEPDCRGWETHDHGSQAWLHGARSSRRPRRPDYRDPDLPQGRPSGATGASPTDLDTPPDDRPPCPGTLMRHRDGKTECRAGSLDDCWDGSKYHHDRRRDCTSLSHGCPTCETTEGLT